VIPQAFAFDLDETLVDCEPQHRAATRAMLQALGHLPDAARDLFHDTTGVSTLALIEKYRGALGVRHTVEEMLSLRHAAFLAALDETPAQPLPGARELLAACAARGPVALVTNGHREDAIASLRSAGLLPFFAALVTAEDAPEPKPAPDPYRIAASRLGVPASDVLAFEDSPRGVASALDAGCIVVATPHARSTKPEAVARAHLVLASLEGALPLEALLARLG
jgi:HAD superfamily hydrolase (TIGR01509 family)